MAGLALIEFFRQRVDRIVRIAVLMLLAFIAVPADAQWTALAAPGQASRTVAKEPTVLAIAKNARILAVGHGEGKSVAFYHPDTAALLGSTNLPKKPAGIVMSDDGTKAYVLYEASGIKIAVIDTATRAITATWGTTGSPVGIVLHGTELVIADDGGNSNNAGRLVGISTTTGNVTRTLSLSKAPQMIGIGASSTLIMVGVKNGELQLRDSSTLAVTRTVTVGEDIRSLAWWDGGSSGNGRVLAVGKSQNALNLVDPATGTIARVVLGGDPNTVGIEQNNNWAYIGEKDDRIISLIELIGRALSGYFTIPGKIGSILFDQSGTLLFVSLTQDDKLLKLDPNQASLISKVGVTKTLKDVAVNSVTAEGIAISSKDTGFARINLATHTVQTLMLPVKADKVVVDASLNVAIVGATNDKLYFVNLATNPASLFAEQVDLDGDIKDMAVDPARSITVALVSGKQRVRIVNNLTRTEIAQVQTADKYVAVAIHSGKGIAYLITDNKKLSLFDLTTRTITQTISLGFDVEGIAIDPTLNRAVLTTKAQDKAWILNLDTLQMVTSLTMAKNPGAVAIQTDTHIAVVASKDDDSLSLVDLATNTATLNFNQIDKPTGLAISNRYNEVLVVSSDRDDLAIVQLSNPTASISAISPTQVFAGASATTLTVTGAHFIDGAVVNFGATALATTWVSSSVLTASIPAAFLTTAGTNNIRVLNPMPGGGASASLIFTIVLPLPVLASVNPVSALADNTAKTFTLVGSNFYAPVSISVTGSVGAQTIAPDSSTLTSAQVTLPATLFNSAGPISIAVTTTAGTSSTKTITVTAVVPPAPTIGIATAGNASATVTFAAPVGNGGSAITSYIAMSSIGNVSGSCTAPCASIFVTGLTNGIAYTFTVKATNAIGAGAASGASNSVMPATLPGAPIIGVVTADNTQVTVVFTAPASNGGSAISSYAATCGSQSNTGNASPITVVGLVNGTAVTCTVTATNAVGTGAASAASNSVTPSTIPGAPTIGTATAGNAQVIISFIAPAFNGGVAITGYIATCGTRSNSGGSSPITVTGLANGAAVTCTVMAINSNGNSLASAASNSVTPTAGNIGPLPPDPATIAPALDATTFSSFFDSTSFLFSGANPIQTGVVPGTINAKFASVIRGKVLSIDGLPRPGIKVTVKNKPEYGSTLSRADGVYDLATNGGGLVTLEFAGNGYLPAQRQVATKWRAHAFAEDVALIQLDSATTSLALPLSAPQVAQGNTMTDLNGARQATMIFPGGTTATMRLPNGNLVALSNATVRMTEYTVGPNGPKAMPAPLPPSSGYTYAVELSIDEAIAAGAVEVQFNNSVPFYVDNFLGFPVGNKVPTAWYDHQRSAWIPSDNGRIVKILAIQNSMATLDVDGSNLAADAAKLLALGITDAERTTLATLYPAGKALWRVPISHFSSWDHNWPVGPPADALPPTNPPPVKDELKDTCDCEGGSIIAAQNRTLGESIPIVNTSFALQYRSDRTPGYTSRIEIPVTGNMVSASLKRIELTINVGGRTFAYSYPAPVQPNLTQVFVFDGLDPYGRLLQGTQYVHVQTIYVYPAIPLTTSAEISRVFGINGNLTVNGDRNRDEVFMGQSADKTIELSGGYDARAQGLGGWTLDVLHAYDPVGRKLHLGNGGRRTADGVPLFISSSAGTGASGFSGDAGPAATATFSGPSDVRIHADGRLVIADTYNNRIRQIDGSGVITTIAGSGIQGFSGDGGPAINAQLSVPEAIAIGTDGSVYMADTGNRRVRRIGTDGIITTVAGGGSTKVTSRVAGLSVAMAPALEVLFGDISGIAVAPDGTLFIADRGFATVYRVGTDGNISVFAGGNGGGITENGPARQAKLGRPEKIALGDDGSLYIADSLNLLVQKVSPSGAISRVVGNGGYGTYFSDPGGGPGGLATLTAIDPTAVTVGQDGALYVATFRGDVYRVAGDGTITLYAGNTANSCPATLDGGASTLCANLQSPMGMAVDPQGTLYIAELDGNRIRRITTPLPSYSAGEFLIPSTDGEEVYAFSSTGRHVRTLNSKTSAIKYEFSYVNGLISQVRDGDGNFTHFDRAGSVITITSADNKITTMTTDASGYATSVADPAGQSYQMQSTSTGLLTRFTNPRGISSVLNYDPAGRLVRDANAAGGFWQVDVVGLADNRVVSMTSAEGRVKRFQTQNLTTGDVLQTNFLADGTFTKTNVSTAKVTTQTAADGTIATSTQGPDPRWGMQAPLGSTVSVSMPSGLTSSATTARTVTLADASNPLSLTSETTTFAVNGRTFTSLYDATARQYTGTSAEGRITTTKNDLQGRPTFAQIAGVEAVNYGYDARGRITGITQGSGADLRSLMIGYGSDGLVQTVTDALTQQVVYQRDAAGRITQTTLPGSRVVGFGFDANSNVTSITPPGRTAHSFGLNAVDLQDSYSPPQAGLPVAKTEYRYNLDKQLTSAIRPDGTTITVGYDSGGRLGTVTPSAGAGSSITYGYSPTSGQISTLANANVTLGYTYDGALPTQENFTGTVTGSLARTYDTNFRVTGLALNGSNIASGYDRDSLLTSAGAMTLARNPANGFLAGTVLGSVSTSQSYNAFGELANFGTSVSGTPIYNFAFTYDKLGRIITKAETIGGSTTNYDYGYDVAGRLETVKQNGTLVRQYGFDANSNRTSVNGSLIGTYDDQDRIQTYAGNVYTFGANGELKLKVNGGQSTQYSYDVFGNLNSVTLPNNTTIEYVADGRNRRVGKKVNGVLTQGFLYQSQLRIAAELDATGNVVSRFVYGTKINVPEYMTKAGVNYRIVTDHLGSVRLVVNTTTGVIAQRIDFDEFGNVLQDTNPGFQPFGFAGGLYDSQTKLVRFGARDYDAEIGRWVAKDPIGFEGGDTNLYSYVRGDPVNFIDPTGLAKSSIQAQVESAVIRGDTNKLTSLIEGGGLSPAEQAAAQQGLRSIEIAGRSTSEIGELSTTLGRTGKEIKEAIHQCKQNLPKSGPQRNPDVVVDKVSGEVYPKLPNGGFGDSIGNIFDFLKNGL